MSGYGRLGASNFDDSSDDHDDSDHDFDYRPSFGRKKKKEDDIYGIFASNDGSSDEDAEEFGRAVPSRRAPRGGKAADYSRPISFVSGGKQEPQDVAKEEAERIEHSTSNKPGIPAYSTAFSDDEEVPSDEDVDGSGEDMNTRILRKFGYYAGDKGDQEEEERAAMRMDEDIEETHLGLGVRPYPEEEEENTRPGLGSHTSPQPATSISSLFHSRFASAAAKSRESPTLYEPVPADTSTPSAPMDTDIETNSAPTPSGSKPISNEEFRKMFLSGSKPSQSVDTTMSSLTEHSASLATEEPASFFAKSQAPVAPKEAVVSPTELGLGRFEKHTKGFGAKYLEKFNFTGRLGRHHQGITAPIEVKVRPSQLGLGYGGFKEATRLKHNEKVMKDYAGKGKEEEGPMKTTAKGAETATPKKRAPKVKTVYKTAAEVLLDEQRKGGDATTGKPGFTGGFGGAATIIDMRGPHTRVIQAGEGVGEAPDVETPLYIPFSEAFPAEKAPSVGTIVPEEAEVLGMEPTKCGIHLLKPEEVKSALDEYKELFHNLQLLVEISEGEIRGLVREKRNLEAELAIQSRSEAAERQRMEQESRHNLMLEQLQKEILAITKEVQDLVSASENSRLDIETFLTMHITPDTKENPISQNSSTTNHSTDSDGVIHEDAGITSVRKPQQSASTPIRRGGLASRPFASVSRSVLTAHQDYDSDEASDDGYGTALAASALKRASVTRAAPVSVSNLGAPNNTSTASVPATNARRGMAVRRRGGFARSTTRWEEDSSDSDAENPGGGSSILLRAAAARDPGTTTAPGARVSYQRAAGRASVAVDEEVADVQGSVDGVPTRSRERGQHGGTTALSVSEYKNKLQEKITVRTQAYEALVCKLGDLPGLFESILSIPQAIQMRSFSICPAIANSMLSELCAQWSWHFRYSLADSLKSSPSSQEVNPVSAAEHLTKLDTSPEGPGASPMRQALQALMPPIGLKDILEDWKLVVTALRQSRTMLSHEFVMSLLETDAEFQKELAGEQGNSTDDEESLLDAPFRSPLPSAVQSERKSRVLAMIRHECDNAMTEFDVSISELWKSWCTEFIETFWKPTLEPELSVALTTLAPHTAFVTSLDAATEENSEEKESISASETKAMEQSWPIGNKQTIRLPITPLYLPKQDFFSFDTFLDLLRCVRARLERTLADLFAHTSGLAAFSLVPKTPPAAWTPIHLWAGVWHAKHLLGYRIRDAQAKRQPPLLFPFWAQLKRAIVAKLHDWDPFDPTPLPFLRHWKNLLPQREFVDLLHVAVLPPLNAFLAHILKPRFSGDIQRPNEYFRQIRKAVDVSCLYLPVLPPMYTCLVFETHILPAILRVCALSLGFGHIFKTQSGTQNHWMSAWTKQRDYFFQAFSMDEAFPSTRTSFVETGTLPYTTEWKSAQPADATSSLIHPKRLSTLQHCVVDILHGVNNLPSPEITFTFVNHWRVLLLTTIRQSRQSVVEREGVDSPKESLLFSTFSLPILTETEADQIETRLKQRFSDVFRMCNFAMDAQTYILDSLNDYLSFCHTSSPDATFPSLSPDSLKPYARIESKLNQYSISIKSIFHSLGVLQNLSFEERVDREKQSLPDVSAPEQPHSGGTGPSIKRPKVLSSQTLASPVLQELLSSIQYTKKASPLATDSTGTSFISFFASMAEESGLFFAPDPTRQPVEGSVVYRIGKFPCYFYKGVVFVDFGSGYKPMDVDSVMQEALRRN